MAAVVSLAERRSGVGRIPNKTPGFDCPLGLAVPAIPGPAERALGTCRRDDLLSGAPWGPAARVLQSVVTEEDRVVALAAGPGILPAIAAKSGAARVIALEADFSFTTLMRQIFAANALDAEALHGRAGRTSEATFGLEPLAGDPSAEPPLEDPAQGPVFDLPLILEEEEISLLMLPGNFADMTLLYDLPAQLSRIVVTIASGECPPSLDLMMVTLIGSGFSFDPSLSGQGVLLFNRNAYRG